MFISVCVQYTMGQASAVALALEEIANNTTIQVSEFLLGLIA